METVMRAVNTNFRSFFSSCVNQITPLHLYSGTRNLGPGPAGTECLRCTALQQQGDVPISQNPRKYVSVDTGEKFKRNEKPPKLHRGWHPGQRTPSPYHREVSTTKDRKTLEEPIWMPRNEQRASNTRREYLFDAEDGDAYVSDHDDYEEGVDESSSDDDEVEDFVPRGVDFREDSTQGSETDLNCRHFSRCSGCILDKELDRPPVLEDANDFFVKRGVPDFSLMSHDLWEWRCRAKLAVRGTPEDPQIGLFEEGTHAIVDIPSCRTHHPRINAAVKLVKEGFFKQTIVLNLDKLNVDGISFCDTQELRIRPYDEDAHTGELRYIQMVVTTFSTSLPAAERYANGKVQVSLVWNARDENSVQANNLNRLAEMLWQRGNPKTANPILHSVWANFQTSRTNVIFGGRWRHLMGETELWERVSGVDIAFTPASFGQANLQAFDALLRRLQKAVKIGSKVVELYAGVGAIGLSLAAVRKCRVVKCVEVNKEGRAVFERSLSRLPASVDSDISWHCADASVSPINWLEDSDVVIVDPPRKGLDLPVIEALRIASARGRGKNKAPSSKTTEKVEKRPWILRAKMGRVHKAGSAVWEEDGSIWPSTLVYVSCSWQAFKLDYVALVEGNAWHLHSAQAFNFFPGTNSIEVLAVFKTGKKPPPKPVRKGSGVRSKSAKSLKFTRAGKKLAVANSVASRENRLRT